MQKPKSVTEYLENGCGRCPLGGTPECKVHAWEKELIELRTIVLEAGLTEKIKWSAPTYTWKNKNIAMVAAFKDYCCISFFKGALINDEKGLLTSPGSDSQSTKQFRVTHIDQIYKNRAVVLDYVKQALDIEKSGKKVAFKARQNLVYPEELKSEFEKNKKLQKAFESLTPGRQRGYILHFNGAKRSETRTSRILKYIPTIMEGKGIHDEYRANLKK